MAARQEDCLAAIRHTVGPEVKFYFSFVLMCYLFFFFPPFSKGAEPGCESYELLLKDAMGHALFAVPINPGESFSIRYTHSVAKSPVEDCFIMKDGSIFLNKTIYKDFGAGLPHNPEPGQTMIATNGNIIITGYDMPLKKFDLRVGRIAGHTLILPWGEKADSAQAREIRLADLIEPGKAITFEIIPTRIYE